MQIADTEWRVMEVLWQKSPRTAAEVVEALEGEVDWTPATVKTLLHRLVQKKALRFSQDGKRYLYAPAVQRKACVKEATRTLVDRVFGGEPLSLVEYFVRSSKLSAEQLQHLKKLVEEQEDRS